VQVTRFGAVEGGVGGRTLSFPGEISPNRKKNQMKKIK
jgi:hypothetical protein